MKKKERKKEKVSILHRMAKKDIKYFSEDTHIGQIFAMTHLNNILHCIDSSKILASVGTIAHAEASNHRQCKSKLQFNTAIYGQELFTGNSSI